MSKILNEYNIKKKENPENIYIFRSGIFYYALNEDAKKLNSSIGLKITSLSPEIIKCGFPVSSLDKYTKKFDNLQLKYQIIDEIPKNININTYYSILSRIQKIDVNNITGVQALNILSELKKEVEK